MKKRRKTIAAQKAKNGTQELADIEQELSPLPSHSEVVSSASKFQDTPTAASEPEVQFHKEQNFQDSYHYMPYTPATLNAYEERAYGVTSGSATSHKSNGDFVTAAQSHTLNLLADDATSFAQPSRTTFRWDKKMKRYRARANDEDGSKGAGKLVVGEGGTKIAASFRSGKFDAWKRKNRVAKMPRVGEIEKAGSNVLGGGPGGGGGFRRWKHQGMQAPKDADKYRDDYHKKKKMVEKAKEAKIGRFSDKGKKGEVRSHEGVRKVRKEEERKKAKNARGGRGGLRGGSRGRGRGKA